jgi:hypothetical protein
MGLLIAVVGKARHLAGRFIDKGQRVVIKVFQFCLCVVERLLFDLRQSKTFFLFYLFNCVSPTIISKVKKELTEKDAAAMTIIERLHQAGARF